MITKINVSKFSQSVWLAAVVCLLFAFVFALYIRSEKQIDDMNDLRLQGHLLSNELRQASNDLSNMAHSYVITGNPICKKTYQKILDIHEGRARRPVEYHNVYWELVLSNNQKLRSQDTEAIALLDLMRQAGFTKEEYAKLAEAKGHFDVLRRIEMEAMKLVDSTVLNREVNVHKASEMLHNRDYFQAKSAIMKPLFQLHEMMDQRMMEAVNAAKLIATLLRIAVIVVGLLLLYLLWSINRKLYTILGAKVDELHTHIARIGRGDFNSPIVVADGMKNSVLGWLSVTQLKLKKIDAKRNKAEARNQRLTKFYAALIQCNQDIARCADEMELFPQICRDAVVFGGMQMAWIGMVDEEGKTLRPVASYGIGTEYLEKFRISLEEKDSLEACPTATAFREDQPFWCQDFQHAPTVLLWHGQAEQFGWKASASLPLHRNGLTIGTFTLYATEVNVFDEAARNLLEEMVIDIDYALSSFEQGARRKEAELALQRSEFNLNRAQAIAHIGSWTLDIPSRRLEWSAEAYRMFQISQEQMISFDIFMEAVHPDDRDMVLKAWNEALEGGTYDIEHRIVIEGNIRWVRELAEIEKDSDGNPCTGIGTVQDITERKEAQNELLKLWHAVEQTPNTIVITDTQGQIEYVNAAFTKTSGYLPSEVIGKNPRLLHSGKTPSDTYEDMWKYLSRGENWKGEFINRHKNGSEYVEAIHVSPIRQADGNITHYMAIEEDITERKKSEDRIHYLANFDSLTGLPNRNQLEENAKFALSFVKRNQGNLAVMFVDLDHFKDINDTLGHSVGDALLIEVAKDLKSLMREEDTVSRFSGDEFIVLLPGTDASGAEQVAQKLMNIIAKPFLIGTYELSITASIGIALYPDDGVNLETLSRSADSAMYRAKEDGRDNYRFFMEEMQVRSSRNLQLNNALRHALKLGQLYLHYQPQVCINDGHIIGVEALLRWQHPELGSVSPSEFIPIAEDNGLILPIGEWILRTAIRQAKSWIDSGLPPIVMAINLSAVQFRHPSIGDLITDILNEMDLPPQYLEVELTEGVAMHDPQAVITIMNNLHERGIRMSIDDFGTGYSSLSYLKKFKVYKLKIDQSFVRDISTDSEDKAIVAAIINMAHSLGLKTIAEGVETAEQLEYLRDQGCDEIQGYYFSRPVDSAVITNYLQNGSFKKVFDY